MFSKIKLSAFAVAAAALMGAATAANAVVIDFGGLANPNGTAFGTYMEDGLTVTATAGDWNEGHSFGNPVPSIFTVGTANHTVDVTRTGGGTFLLNSVDFGCGRSAAADCDVSATGFLGALQIFSLMDTFADDGTFSTVVQSTAGLLIDRLVLLQNQGDSNIDNIDVTIAAISEPGTLALFGLSLAGLGFARLKRAA